MCTGLVFWVFIRHNNTPLVKASGRELCYILLLGVFMSYAMTFLFLAKPSPAICALRRLGLGTSFAVCYSALLTKTNRIARIFSAVKDGAGAARPRFISPFSQVGNCSITSSSCNSQMDRWTEQIFMTYLPLLFSFLGFYLFESYISPVDNGVSVAATGSSRDTALHIARETTDCHPQV